MPASPTSKDRPRRPPLRYRTPRTPEEAAETGRRLGDWIRDAERALSPEELAHALGRARALAGEVRRYLNRREDAYLRRRREGDRLAHQREVARARRALEPREPRVPPASPAASLLLEED